MCFCCCCGVLSLIRCRYLSIICCSLSAVNFINVFPARIFCLKVCSKPDSKLPKWRSYKKICTLNVDKIDTSRQFHQRFTRAFFVQKLHFGSFSSYVLALAPKFRTKKMRENVDEIDTSSPVSFTLIFFSFRSSSSKNCYNICFTLLLLKCFYFNKRYSNYLVKFFITSLYYPKLKIRDTHGEGKFML